MTKVQSMAKKLGDGHVQIFLNSQFVDGRESRAVPFISGFKFVSEVGQYKTGILKSGSPVDENGYYRYIDSGVSNLSGIDYVLIPNAPLERGIRLENWFPEFETNWKIMDEFNFNEQDLRIGRVLSAQSGFCVFYLGSEMSNTTDGHNRGPVWKPEDWALLGRLVQEHLDLKIVVVGADYDRSYWENCVRPLVKAQSWMDLVGQAKISETFGLIRSARFVVSFQSGIGIVAEYMGIPAALFWRAKGDSISPHFYLSFEEKMNGAWSPPEMLAQGKHLALIYGKHSSQDVISQILERGW